MPQANVKSTEAILAVKNALAGFSKQTTDGIAELDAEVRRTFDWLENDRPTYWKERVRRAYDRVGEAKDELARCLTFHASESHRPSCIEQRAALKKAKAHLEYCLEKQKRVVHWVREVAKEMHEYRGRVAGLMEVAEGDMPDAVAMLERALVSIEEYTVGSVSNVAKPAESVEKPEEDNGTIPDEPSE